ncbi:MAG: Ig-like domain repeat protein [Eubacteriales bacterium]
MDDISGVKYAYVSFEDPSGSKWQIVPLAYDENIKLWVGSYIIKATDESGTYTKFNIEMIDNAGNQVNGSSLLDPFKDSLTFTVNNNSADITPPQVISAETMPKVLNVGDILTFRLNILDDISGVKYVYIGFKNPSGSRVEFFQLAYDENIKLWVGSYTIKATDEGGTYTKFMVDMIDNAGNKVNSYSLLDPFKDSLTFTIRSLSGTPELLK